MSADLRTTARWPGLSGSSFLGELIRRSRRAALVGCALLACFALQAPAEQADSTKFDHLTTGFPLDGRHLNLRCEQCHLNGVFEGTPRTCGMCHIQGNPRSAVFMPDNHISRGVSNLMV